jgi:tetratricopeptide (TPR) repeat protein
MSPRSFSRFTTFVTAAGLVLQPGFSQSKGAGSTGAGAGTAAGSTSTGTGSTGTGAGAGSTTRPTTTTPPINTPQQTTPPPMQPIFLSGRVMLEDGTAPAESVVIERVCSGATRTEGYTDAKGYFSIRLGDPNNGVMHDASEEMGGFGSSVNGGLGGGNSGMSSGSRGMGGENRFFDCELRARMAGYRSQSVTLANRRPMDPPDVGVILLHRLGASEGSTVSMAILSAPKDAKKAYEKGLEAMKKHKPEDAVKNFQKAVDAYPKHAAAWNELGRLRAAAGDENEARAYFQKAMEADPKFVGPYLETAMLEWKAEHWQPVAELTAKVIQLDTFDYPQAFFLNALSNYYLKDLDTAEKSAREALRLDTRHQFVTTYRLLGVILAQKQDYPGAAEQLKTYVQLAPQAKDIGTVRTQLAQLEKLLSAKQE